MVIVIPAMATRETFLLLYGLVMVLVVAAEASYERPKNTRTIQFPFFNKASTSSEPEQVRHMYLMTCI